MDTFAPLFNEGAIFDEDPYFSLSQFDIELQQQAQAALLPQEAWHDFDKYLPAFEESQPIFMNDYAIVYEDKKQVQHEYASPESLPESPPRQSASPDMPLFTPHLDSTPPIDFMSWTLPANTTIETHALKVPIQRLKQNSIVTDAVNAALLSHPTGKQHKKTAHNAIERRYRNNINDRIAELKNAVPALLYAKVNHTAPRNKRSREDEEDEEDGEDYLDGVAVATKLNKATILRKATEYINHLKRTGDECRRENQTLQHILNQLPGGTDILKRYHLQKQQRDKEVQQQMMMERELQKQYEQQRKMANRKRAKSSSSSSSSSDSSPAMSQRVFMAVFMCITFFSTSPIQSVPHPHPVHTSSDSSVTSFFQFGDAWSVLRTIVFMVCLFQLLIPAVKKLGFITLKKDK
ncbi:helix-loop-helix DNA-binding domain-containing protein [Pilobolus umbonatus]|nr:helix-loop-helix DNA-binding domain-containing protein [Pilobolus umbonatus]